MESAAFRHRLEPGQRDIPRVAGFVLLAMALHALALWFVRLPPAGTTDREASHPLRITIRAQSAAEPEDEPIPPVDSTGTRDRKPEPTATPAPPVPPEASGAPAESMPYPDIDPARLLRRMTPLNQEARPRFGVAPKPHEVFREQSVVPSGREAAEWTRGIWKRSSVSRETRFRTTEGRQVLVRRFDNGDIQVCDRAPDDIFSQWDDELPFVCER